MWIVEALSSLISREQLTQNSSEGITVCFHPDIVLSSFLSARLLLNGDVLADGAAHDDLVVGLEVVEVLDDLALVAELLRKSAAGRVVERELGRAVDVGLHGSLGALSDEPGDRQEAPFLFRKAFKTLTPF